MSVCRRYMDRLSLAHPQLGTWPTTHTCPDWESNWQPLSSQASTQFTEPHQLESSSLMLVFLTVNFPLGTALTASHMHSHVLLSFSFILKYFIILLVISSLTHWLLEVCFLNSTYLWIFQCSLSYWFVTSFHCNHKRYFLFVFLNLLRLVLGLI